MSTRFYLNDCIPSKPQNGVNVVDAFRDLIKQFIELRKNNCLDIDQVWTTSDNVDNVALCGIGLRQLLGMLKPERELYSYASRLVTNGVPIIYQEAELAGDVELLLSFLFNGRDAHCLLIAQKLDMIAASISVENALSVNSLQLIYTHPTTGVQTIRAINNWHVGNNAYITNLLTPPLPPLTAPWDRLIAMLFQHGVVKWSKSFKEDWDKLGSGIQQLIVGRFEDALNGGLLFPANANNKNILKPDQKDKTSKVHELRQKGDGFRVYLECDKDAIFLALYGTKTYHHGADQEADFKIAKTEAQRLRQEI